MGWCYTHYELKGETVDVLERGEGKGDISIEQTFCALDPFTLNTWFFYLVHYWEYRTFY